MDYNNVKIFAVSVTTILNVGDGRCWKRIHLNLGCKEEFRGK